MKRYGNLFKRLISFENIYLACIKAKKRKRYKQNVLKFNNELENNILKIREELAAKTYKPGEYKKFMIYEPKEREISAAPYYDRVVHHCLCNIIGPIFEKTFIYDSYANRVDKGTHKAILRYQESARNNKFVLKCDIKKYFPSIDHQILKALIRGKVKDNNVLWLIDLIIDNSNKQINVLDYFPGDDLFAPYSRRRGLPIGNLTSQFFANIYLSPLDHFVKEELRCRYYIRYVDDFVLFADEKAVLWEYLKAVTYFLETRLRLKFSPGKVNIFPVKKGVKFLGYKVFPHKIYLKLENIKRFRQRMRWYNKLFLQNKLSRSKISRSVKSWIGYAGFAESYKIRKIIFKDIF